jgi:hypothetical protein
MKNNTLVMVALLGAAFYMYKNANKNVGTSGVVQRDPYSGAFVWQGSGAVEDGLTNA